MMNKWKMLLGASILVLATAQGAKAQSVEALQREVETLREDVEVLQRQMYRDKNDFSAPATSGNVQQRLSQLEETVRQVSGRMDELEYQLKKVDERFELMNNDIDVRFKLLEGKPIKGTGAGTAAKTKRYEAPKAQNAPKAVVGEAVTGEDLAPLEMPKKETPKAESKTRSVQEIYQEGLDAFNAKKHDAAEDDFELILKDYPKDKLAGNAQYWLGEVYFSRNDFAKAAVAFGKGYKNYKDGNKGADSMYKLGVAMQRLGKNAEACAAYQSLPSEFPKAEKALLDKAKKAAQTLKCK